MLKAFGCERKGITSIRFLNNVYSFVCHTEMSKNRWNVSFSGWSSGWQLGVRELPGVDLFLMQFDQGHRIWSVHMFVDSGHSGGLIHWLIGLFSKLGPRWWLQWECLITSLVCQADGSGLPRWQGWCRSWIVNHCIESGLQNWQCQWWWSLVGGWCRSWAVMSKLDNWSQAWEW